MRSKMSLKPYSFEPNVSDIDSFEPNYSVSLCLPNVQGRAQVEVNEWCNCAKMSNDLECMCCSEFDNVKQLLDSKKCVTATASFEKIILDEEILNITRQQMIKKTKNKVKKKQLSALEVLNKTWRYICYVQFTHWVNLWTSLEKELEFSFLHVS
ncbi:hypothetical protein QTP88_024789 [Uroleucon formosanum]